MRSLIFDPALQPVRNLAINPKCDVDLTGWNPAGNSGTKSLSRSVSGGPFGGPYCRMTWTAASPVLSINTDLFQFGTVSWGGQTIGAAIPVKPFTTYSVSYYVRPSKTVILGAQLQGILGAGGAGQSAEGSTTCPANAWTRLSMTWTTVSNTAALRVDLDHMDSTVNIWNVGDTLDIANIMLTESTTDLGYYADGGTPGWQWTSTPGASQSVGYPVLDVRQLALGGAPIYSDATTGNAGIESTPAYLGPTGLPVCRVETTGNPMGWGVYLGANLNGTTIPAGAKFRLTWWCRSNFTLSNSIEVVDMPATAWVVNRTALSVQTTAWSQYEFVGTTLIPWVAGVHQPRTPLSSGQWLEWSDMKLRVLH